MSSLHNGMHNKRVMHFFFISTLRLLLCAIALFVPAMTQEKKEKKIESKARQEAKVSKRTVSVLISRSLCRQIVITYKAPENVNYKPDHPVPADLSPPQDFGLSDVEIEILLPLENFVSNPTNFSPTTQTAIGKSQVHGGKIKFSKDGKLTINDRSVGDEARSNFEKICRAHYPDI